MSDHALPIYTVSSAPLFDPGALYITASAQAMVLALGTDPLTLMARHVRGDWGDLADADRKSNAEALLDGDRIVSSYLVGPAGSSLCRAVVWIVSERAEGALLHQRPCTTMLLPGDF